MSMVKKSITITDHQESWIQAQMASGQYATDSELIREALREKEKRTAGIEYIRAKLIRAEQGGFVDKTQDEILEGFKEKAHRGAKL